MQPKRFMRAILFLAMWGASIGLPMFAYSAAADQDVRVSIGDTDELAAK